MRAGWGSMRAPLASQSTVGDLRFEREAGRDAGEGGGAEATDCREFTALRVFYAVPQIRAEPGQPQTCAGKGKAPFLKAESVWFARSGVGFYAAESHWGHELGPGEKVSACRGVVYHPSPFTTQSRRLVSGA